MGSTPPSKGDVLVIQTRKSGDKQFLTVVKDVVNGNEVILQKSTNSFYNHDMYYTGTSWVKKIWNLGTVELTTSVNNTNQFYNK
tara:strand:+ start:3944 stop:4195 length:252 start_codon:yes stop_codon:yes gene_type:complete